MSKLSRYRRLSLLLALVAGLSPAHADYRTYSQLWQIGGHSLPDLDELALPLTEIDQPAQSRRNPALISGATGWGLAFTHQAQTGDPESTWRKAVPRSRPWMPAGAALRGWLGPLAVGTGWEQRYNSHERTWVTPFDTLSAGRDWDARLERWNFQAAWDLLPPCCGGLGLRLGAGLSRNSLRVDQVEAQRYLGEWSWQAGGRAQWGDLVGAVGWEGPATWSHVAPVWTGPARDQRDTVQVWGRLPQAWHAQAGWTFRPGWSADLNLRFTEWSGQLLGFRDRLEAALLLHHALPGAVGWHAGLASSGTNPVRGSWLDKQFDGEQSTLFLLGGVSLPLGPARLDLKVADSHLGPGAFRKQTIIQVGLGRSFPAGGK